MSIVFLVLNLLFGLLLIVLVSNNKLPIVQISLFTKVGLWVGAIGLVSQALRTGYELFLGAFPFANLPIWMLKDFGYWFVVVGLLIHALERKSKEID